MSSRVYPNRPSIIPVLIPLFPKPPNVQNRFLTKKGVKFLHQFWTKSGHSFDIVGLGNRLYNVSKRGPLSGQSRPTLGRGVE